MERFRGIALAAALLMALGSAGCMGLTTPGTGSGSPGGDSLEISVSPSTLGFGSVVDGTTASQTITITNTGTASVTVSSVTLSGTTFTITGVSTPLTIGAGQSVTFTVSFKPSGTSTASGTISITSNAENFAVDLSGTGVAADPTIAANTSSLSFGNVTVNTSASQPVVLTNTGNANLNITSVSASGAGFSASGGSNVTLAPNQSTSVTVTFDPTAAGSVTGGLTIKSNATNTPSVQLTGAGVSAAKHSVALNWNAASGAIGYFVYRGTTNGGPYAKVVPSMDGSSSYTDGNVSDGQTYYYVVTSVSTSQVESAYSNQVSVTIPNTN